MQSQDHTTTFEEVVLIDPIADQEAGFADDGANSVAGIVLGLLLIILAIAIGVARLARERRGRPVDHPTRPHPSHASGRTTAS